MAPLAVLLALLGVGLATWALMKAPTADNTAIAQQVGDPKANVCIAFQTVIKAVSLQSHSNLGSDPAAQQAVAANARLALLGGGGYLLGRIPVATPPELADAVRGFAGKLQDIGMNYLAGVPDADSEQASRLTDAEALSGKILGMCQ